MDFYTFDDEYVRRLREGHRETVEHYFNYFNFFLRQRLHGRVPFDDIADVIQTVHVRVLIYLGSDKEIRDAQSFGAFVFGFADNIVRERRRDHSTEPLEDIHAGDADQLRNLLMKERKAGVHRRLASLEPRDAAILRAVFIDERDKDKICKEFDISRNYLRVLVYRALEKFRDKFDGS
jgi:RNA polymerase sigma-70 factor (ECF subfamily)